tara:strand:- start:11115 stop:12554 length:1440 start_codon:yes stop_codon:yes gene_type:complete
MAEASLLEPKELEVSNLARRMGVDRFVQTDRFGPIKALMNAWADSTEDMDALTRESTWLDVKRQIEDIMVNMSLENNTTQELFLLGQTAAGPTGEVNYDEVRQAFASGFNTLMSQYGFIIANLSQFQMGSLNRLKDKAMNAIPAYGTISGKQDAAQASSQALDEIEQCIVNFRASAERSFARKEIGQRETARAIMLAQAESNLTSGALTQAEYDEIHTLIGRRNSLFEEQLDAIKNFSGNLGTIFEQMDRTIAAASNVLQQVADNSLQGTRISGALGATNNSQKGDGFRTADWKFTGKSHMAQTVGYWVPNMISSDPSAYSLLEGPAGYPWVGSLESQLKPPVQNALALAVDTSFLPSHRQNDPRLASKEGYWAMSGSRKNKMATKMTRNRMAGVGGHGLGATIEIGDDVQFKTKTIVDIAALGVLGYGLVQLGKAYTSERTKRLQDQIGAGIHSKQIKLDKAIKKRQRKSTTTTPTVA